MSNEQKPSNSTSKCINISKYQQKIELKYIFDASWLLVCNIKVELEQSKKNEFKIVNRLHRSMMKASEWKALVLHSNAHNTMLKVTFKTPTRWNKKKTYKNHIMNGYIGRDSKIETKINYILFAVCV